MKLDNFPSKFVVIAVQYGEGRKHFYSLGEPIFCRDHDEVDKQVRRLLDENPKRMYAVCPVKKLCKVRTFEIESSDAED